MTRVNFRFYEHPDDYEGVRNLLVETGLYDEQYDSPVQIAKVAERLPDMITVAAIGSQIAGVVFFQDGIPPRVSRFAVASEYRDQRLGTKLIAKVNKQARMLGHTGIEASLDPRNTFALATLTAAGYDWENPSANLRKDLNKRRPLRKSAEEALQPLMALIEKARRKPR